MTTKNTIITKEKAQDLLGRLGAEYALLPNPAYIHPAYEIVPLAPKRTRSDGPLIAAVMDMDGTTTTTEELCIHSLEYMLRRSSNRMTKEEWPGLDHARDYPHIIGNSTTKHVEYLIATYHAMLDEEAMRAAFIHAAVWTLTLGRDEQRKKEVTANCRTLGLDALLEDPRMRSASPPVEDLMRDYAAHLRFRSDAELVRAAIDIYYQRYHEILGAIERGEGEEIARTVLGDATRHLIEPMPGIGIALAVMKGWLGRESALVCDMLCRELEKKSGVRLPASERTAARERLAGLGAYFEAHPLKVAVVTSSIFYEADIVMTEVCRVIRSGIDDWPLSDEKKALLREKFSSYHAIYDAFVTANDSSEIRLKPHRDLYSMALHALGIGKEDFGRVAGFEDSESGTFAIRAAGIGLCVAVPFEHSKGHNLDAASLILPGGAPEAMLVHGLFMHAGDAE